MSLGDLGVSDVRAIGAFPGDDLQPAVEMLDRGAATLDPIAAIDVARRREVADRGLMDVAADYALGVPPRGLAGERLLEAADGVEHVLDLVARPPRQRPARQVELPTHDIDGGGSR